MVDSRSQWLRESKITHYFNVLLMLTLLLGVLLTPNTFAQSSEADNSNTALSVKTVLPKRNHQGHELVLSGTIESSQHANITALEAGRVARIYVEEGDVVNAGDPLLSLDNELAKLGLSRASAMLDAAKVNQAEAKRLYNEVLQLSKSRVVAQSTIAERAALLANAEAELQRSEADVQLQQAILRRHQLIAPFSGVIALRNVNVGEWITQQSSAFSLINQQKLRMRVDVPQEYFAAFSRLLASNASNKNRSASPHSVQIALDTQQQAVALTGTLSRIVGVAENRSRSFTAFININTRAHVIPGMSAQARFTVPNPTQNTTAVELPRNALKLHPDGGSSVFVAVRDNGQMRAKRLFVKWEAHASDNNMIVATFTNNEFATVTASSSNQSQTPFIISGVELLADNQRINIEDIEGIEDSSDLAGAL